MPQVDLLADQVVEAVKFYVGRATTEFATKLNAIDQRIDASQDALKALVNDHQLLILTLSERIDAIPAGPVGEPGPRGEPGADGVNGKDGRDGIDGKDGAPGRDGVDGVRGEKGDRGEVAPLDDEEDPEVIQMLLTGVMRSALYPSNVIDLKELKNGSR